MTEVGGVRTNQMIGGSYAELQSDADGRFEVSGLRAGTYQASAGGAMLFGSSPSAPARVTVGPIEVAEDARVEGIEIRLPPACRAVITVRDGAGQPVPGASVFLRDGEGRHTELFSMTTTGPAGRVSLDGLAEGTYTVAVRMARLASAESAPFRVAPGEVARVELVAEEGTTVVAVCKGRGDDPVPSARVQLLDDQGRDVSRRIGLADVQNLYKAAAFDLAERRMGPFPPGQYVLVAESDDGRRAKKFRISRRRGAARDPQASTARAGARGLRLEERGHCFSGRQLEALDRALGDLRQERGTASREAHLHQRPRRGPGDPRHRSLELIGERHPALEGRAREDDVLRSEEQLDLSPVPRPRPLEGSARDPLAAGELDPRQPALAVLREAARDLEEQPLVVEALEAVLAQRELVHRPTGDGSPLLHQQHVTVEAQKLVELVADVDHRQIEARSGRAEVGKDLTPQAAIEAGEGFVEQQQPRRGEQRAAESDALALAAGTGGGTVLQQGLEIEELDHLVQRRAGPATPHAVAQVPQHRAVRKESMVLEDHPHPPTVHRREVPGRGVEEHVTANHGARRPDLAQAREAREPAGLPRAGGAEHAEHRARRARVDLDVESARAQEQESSRTGFTGALLAREVPGLASAAGGAPRGRG